MNKYENTYIFTRPMWTAFYLNSIILYSWHEFEIFISVSIVDTYTAFPNVKGIILTFEEIFLIF